MLFGGRVGAWRSNDSVLERQVYLQRHCFSFIFFFMYLSVLPECVYVQHIHAFVVPSEARGGVRPPELEIRMVVSHYEGAEN